MDDGYVITQLICRKIVHLLEKLYSLINCMSWKKSIQTTQKVRQGARAAEIVTFGLVEWKCKWKLYIFGLVEWKFKYIESKFDDNNCASQ